VIDAPPATPPVRKAKAARPQAARPQGDPTLRRLFTLVRKSRRHTLKQLRDRLAGMGMDKKFIREHMDMPFAEARKKAEGQTVRRQLQSFQFPEGPLAGEVDRGEALPAMSAALRAVRPTVARRAPTFLHPRGALDAPVPEAERPPEIELPFEVSEKRKRAIARAAKGVSPEQQAKDFDFVFRTLAPAMGAATFGHRGPFFEREKAFSMLLDQMPESTRTQVRSDMASKYLKNRQPFMKAAKVLMSLLRKKGVFPPAMQNKVIEGSLTDQWASTIIDDIYSGRHRSWPADWKKALEPHIGHIKDLPFHMTQEDVDTGLTSRKVWSKKAGAAYRRFKSLTPTQRIGVNVPDRPFPIFPPLPSVPTTKTHMYRAGVEQVPDDGYTDMITGATGPGFFARLLLGTKRLMGSHMAGFLDVDNQSGRQKWKSAVGFTRDRIAERKKDPVFINFVKNQKELVEGLAHLVGDVFGLLGDKAGDLITEAYKDYLQKRGIIRPLTRAEHAAIRMASGGEKGAQLIGGVAAATLEMFKDPVGSFQADPLFTTMTVLAAARGLSALAGASKIAPKKVAALSQKMRALESGLMKHTFVTPVKAVGKAAAKIPGVKKAGEKVGAAAKSVQRFFFREPVGRLLGALDDVDNLGAFFEGRLERWRKKATEAMKREDFGTADLIDLVGEIGDDLARENVSSALLSALDRKLHEQVARGAAGGPRTFESALGRRLRELDPDIEVLPTDVVPTAPIRVTDADIIPGPPTDRIGHPPRLPPEQLDAITQGKPIRVTDADIIPEAPTPRPPPLPEEVPTPPPARVPTPEPEAPAPARPSPEEGPMTRAEADAMFETGMFDDVEVPPRPAPTPEDAPAAPVQVREVTPQTYFDDLRGKSPTPEDFVFDLMEAPGPHKITITPGPQAGALAEKLKGVLRRIGDEEIEAKVREIGARGGGAARSIQAWAEGARRGNFAQALEAGKRALDDPSSVPVVMDVEGGMPVPPRVGTRVPEPAGPKPEGAPIDFAMMDPPDVKRGLSAMREHLGQIIAGLESGKPFQVVAGSEAASRFLKGINQAPGQVFPGTLSLFDAFRRMWSDVQQRRARTRARGEEPPVDVGEVAAQLGIKPPGEVAHRAKILPTDPVFRHRPQVIKDPAKRLEVIRDIVNRAEVDTKPVLRAERSHLADGELQVARDILDGKIEGVRPALATEEMIARATPEQQKAFSHLVPASDDTLAWMGKEGQKLRVDPALNRATAWEAKMRRWFGIDTKAGTIATPLRFFSSQFKRAMTATNPITFTGNLVSNLFLRAVVTGVVNPVKLIDAVRGYRDFKKGKRVDPTDRKLYTLFEKRGWGDFTQAEIRASGSRSLFKFLEDFSADKGGVTGKAFSRLAGGANKVLRKLEEMYRVSDIWFKLEHGMREAKRIIKGADDLEAGQSITMPMGVKREATVFRGEGGKLRLGSKKGKVLSPDELIEMAGDSGRYSANQLYFDYSKVPGFMQIMRRSGLDAFFSPFYTWFYKAMWVPGLKAGLGKHILTGGMQGLRSTSPKVHRDLMVGRGKQAATRLAMVTAAHASQAAYNDADDTVLRTLMGFKEGRQDPFVGIAFPGSGSNMTRIRLSGLDVSGAQLPLFRLFGGIESAVRGLEPSHPIFVGRPRDYSTEGTPQHQDFEDAVASGKRKGDADKKAAAEEAARRLESPVDRARIISEVRRNFPGSGNAVGDILTILPLMPGGFFPELLKMVESMAKGDTNKWALDSVLSTIIQTKAPVAMLRKGAPGYLGAETFDVAKKGLGRGQKLTGRLKQLASVWRKRTAPHDQDEIEGASAVEAFEMEVKNAMHSMAVRAMMIGAARRLVGELKAKGFRVRLKGGELEFIPESEPRQSFLQRTRERQRIRSLLMSRGRPATEENIDRVLGSKQYKKVKKRALQEGGVRL
jgi:hypothetical protein